MLITDVIWATETHTHLLFKKTNRVQDMEITHLVTIDKEKAYSVPIRTYKPTDGGWIEPSQTMIYMPPPKTSIIQYLDIIDDNNGYMHLALLSIDKNTTTTHWLTSGDWEVIPGSVAADHKRHRIYYLSTERSSLERHLYMIQGQAAAVCLTPSDEGYYSAKFSPHLGYYILQYDGPDIPTTFVKSIENSAFEVVLQDNRALRSLLQEYDLPKTRMLSVHSGGVAMNAMEIVPPDFDASKKYPVLFHVYGGPGSQLVSYKYELSWSTYLAGKLGYIVVTVRTCIVCFLIDGFNRGLL